MGKKRQVAFENSEGEIVNVEVGDGVVDFLTPQKDLKLDIIPEFVNISNKIQMLCIPNNSNNTLEVPKYGILKGAQWRGMSVENNRSWGIYPPFIERKLKNGKYDLKYVLTKDQMIDEIEVLKRSFRITELLEHSVIVEDDFVNTNGHVETKRVVEDREEVVTKSLYQIQKLDIIDKKNRERLGINIADDRGRIV